jgi:hypothetical protein
MSPDLGRKVEILEYAMGLTHELLENIYFSIDNRFQNEQSIFEDILLLSEEISQFVELTTLSTRLLQNNRPRLTGAIKESHINLLSIMKAIHQMREKQDKLALCELIKHELRDNLTLWKIEFIPQIKRLLSN